MTNAQSPETYLGRDAVDPQGNKIGSVGQVYVNDETAQPDWVTINTGFFGLRESFAPLQGSSFDGDSLVLPFDKSVVKDAPEVADASHLDPNEQDALYGYYRDYIGASSGYPTGSVAGYQDSGYQTDSSTGDITDDAARGSTDDAMTRSEEQLNVGTERVEAGRARLRKYVVTEQQTVTVPVSREEVRVEREPITDANVGDALEGPELSEAEHEVVLHEERPVVETEAVPVERVRLGTETVADQQRISADVRKEQIEVHDETADAASRTTDSGTVSDDIDPNR